jgi:hypothetical protein
MRTAFVQHSLRAAGISGNSATQAAPRMCAWGVVGAIILLATLVGAHDLAHLQGGLDARRCVECQWSYDTGASVVTGALVLFPILALLGLCLSPKPAPAVAPSRRARPPRAPPALG